MISAPLTEEAPAQLRTLRSSAASPRKEEDISSLPTHSKRASLLVPTATASLAAHFLFAAWFGTGIPAAVPRAARLETPPVTPVQVETLLVESETPPPVQTLDPANLNNDTTTPEPAPELEIPTAPKVSEVTAVASTVPVSFGIHVTGPVRLVSDAAHAGSGVSRARLAQPVALDGTSEQDLILPVLSYPARAKRQRLTGTVQVEFRANASGDITDVRVRKSSGHSILDEAAKSNLLAGRWKGRPGYYVKGFEFSLR